MILKRIFFSIAVTLVMFAQTSIAQTDSVYYKHKIAVFAPLFLDSAFDGSFYRYDKQFPKFINPGLEFYEGVQLALDSLDKEGAQLEVFIYDTRSTTESISQLLNRREMDGIELIIAHATVQENKLFADAARARMIPYINPNLPNDGGITNNPYFVLLNSTLKTHVEGIYRHIQRNYPKSPVIVFRKRGQMEDMIRNYLEENTKNNTGAPLSIKYVDLIDSFNVHQLIMRLDSNRHTVCIAGSLDENFARRLSTQLAAISKSYRLSIIGMPTFEIISRELTRPEYKGPEFVYSTPFYNPRTDKVSAHITQHFNTRMYARPSDMVMRGYEAAWRFSKLLLRYKKDITSNITRKDYNVFREFDIQPVINKESSTLDYFENKKLYFIKWQDGVIRGVY